MTTTAFDDINAINALVSDDFGEFGPEVQVTQDMINSFADVTGDHQWIHVDIDRCEKESPFGGPIAHGFLTLSLLPRLSEIPIELSGAKNIVNFGATQLRFLRPVPAGAVIHGRTRLLGAEKHRAGTLISYEAVIHLKDTGKRSLRYTAQILFQG